VGNGHADHHDFDWSWYHYPMLTRRRSSTGWRERWFHRSLGGWLTSVGLVVSGVAIAADLPEPVKDIGLAILAAALTVNIYEGLRALKSRRNGPNRDGRIGRDT
jgi:hypothetical protein